MLREIPATYNFQWAETNSLQIFSLSIIVPSNFVFVRTTTGLFVSANLKYHKFTQISMTAVSYAKL